MELEIIVLDEPTQVQKHKTLTSSLKFFLGGWGMQFLETQVSFFSCWNFCGHIKAYWHHHLPYAYDFMAKCLQFC